MKLIEGVVEAISVKELPGGEDQWGNTCRISVKVGDDWIGIGTSKKPEVNIKEGAGWHKLAKGDTIAVVAEENGQWLNAKRSDIKIKAKDSGGASPARSSGSGASGPRATTASASVDWAAKDAGAAASASIDKALRYIALRNGEMKTDYTTILSIARDMQNMVKTLAAEILNPSSEKKSDEDKPPMTNGLSKNRGGKPKPVEPNPEEFVDDEELF